MTNNTTKGTPATFVERRAVAALTFVIPDNRKLEACVYAQSGCRWAFSVPCASVPAPIVDSMAGNIGRGN